MYEVRDVMTRDVLTLSPDVTVEGAIMLIIGNQISGMPVVDEQKRVIGIISEFQLLETLYSPTIRNAQVGDVMTRDVLTVAPDTMLSEAASLMVLHRIRRLPVIDEGKVVGVVARRDLLRYAIESGDDLNAFLNEVREWEDQQRAVVDNPIIQHSPDGSCSECSGSPLTQ